MLTLGELAGLLELEPGAADPATPIRGIAPLDRAGPDELSFISDKRYLDTLRGTRAACVLLREEWAVDCPVPSLSAADPYLAYARASRLFETRPTPAAGIHPGAQVHASAVLGEDVSIAAGAVVDAEAVLGDRVVVASGAVIGAGATLGAGTRIESNAVLYHGVTLGEDCTVHACSVIGADGFGYAPRGDGWEKISQLGSVRIGNRVEIGASSTIDRGPSMTR